MKLKGLKWWYSKRKQPRCFGTGGNLSTFDCNLCAQSRQCSRVQDIHVQKFLTDRSYNAPDPCTFFSWSKEGEYYKSNVFEKAWYWIKTRITKSMVV